MSSQPDETSTVDSMQPRNGSRAPWPRPRRPMSSNVSDASSIGALAFKLMASSIDVLINNAGVFGDRAGFGSVDYDVWANTLRVNTMAPLMIAEQLVDQVARGQLKVIAQVTSKMGSIADNTSGGMYVYRSSKAALNMVNKSLALDLAPRGITCVVLHPGWVATDMGGAGAPLQPEPSVRGMRAVLAGLTPAQSGKFFNYDGAELPW